MLWVALDCPLLPLEALLRGQCSSRSAVEPWAVADARTVLACNAAAGSMGVRPGMGLAAAHALAPALRVGARNPAAEHAALEAIALWLCRFTPSVSPEPPRSMLGEIEGSLRLFGGARALLGDLKRGLADLGFEASIAIGRTPRAALWRAIGGGGRLEDLPVTVAGPDAATLDFLRGIGVDSIGDLMRMPRAGLARRVGPGLLDDVDRAFGVRPEARAFFVPPEAFSAKLELPGEVTEAQAVLFAARRLVVQLEAFLVVRHAGVRRFVLLLLHRHAKPRAVDVALAAPLRDAGHFLLLLRERLDAVRLTDPVDEIRLDAGDLAPLAGRSGSLFGDERADAEGWLRLIERLRARLGEHAVHGLAVHPEHRPEHAWCVVKDVAQQREDVTQRREDVTQRREDVAKRREDVARRRVEPGAKVLQVPDAAGPRPLWLLDPPRRLGESEFTLLAGPERIESGWWDGGEVLRDYFIAQARDTALLWIYRERRVQGGWFLHGIFA